MALLKHQWQSEEEFNRPKYQVHTSDIGEEVVTITEVVHTIRMGDVEDPDLMIAQPIWEWQQTDAGKWIMENSNPVPSWHHHTDVNTYGHIYQIRAYLTHKQLTYYKLKFE
jgi:3'-phosphoadenosine 5'-phosphosulfate sulfotransferase (PAPS reductase)/FAD synthetase